MLDPQILKSALGPKPDCLSPEILEKLATGENASDPHLASCAYCQAQLAMLREFQSNAPLADEGAAVAWISAQLERRLEQIKNPRRRQESTLASRLSQLFGHTRLRLAVPVAAAIALAIAVILLRPSKEPKLRAQLEPSSAIMRSQAIDAITPSGELLQAPRRLEWKAFRGAARYRVELMEVDQVSIWESQTNDNSVTIPGFVESKLLPEKWMLWRVTAFDSQGRKIASSQLQRFAVSRPKKK